MSGFFRRLSSSRPKEEGLSLENFFTEVWAHGMRRNPGLVTEVLSVLSAPNAQGPFTVDTQAQYPPALLPGSQMSCYPDLRVTCDECVLLCEHKIAATQHDEQAVDEAGNAFCYSQLERYLNLTEVAYVAFISQGPHPIKPSVRQHPRLPPLMACSLYLVGGTAKRLRSPEFELTTLAAEAEYSRATASPTTSQLS